LAKFAAAARAYKGQPVTMSEVDRVELDREGLSWLVGASTTEELVRVALLLDSDTRLAPADMQTLADDCFRHGDSGERRAVLRALALLTEPSRYVELAAQACRSSVGTVFEAIACENPFPAAFFPELAFNQMVLKALFTEVPLGRIMGLEKRVTPELGRMAKDYEAERRAAGRSVPADIAKLVDPGAPDGDG
jgi:hypothetical protein